jgi:hypothetical protein
MIITVNTSLPQLFSNFINFLLKQKISTFMGVQVMHICFYAACFCWFLTWLILQHWRWTFRCPDTLGIHHDTTIQTTAVFIVTATVRIIISNNSKADSSGVLPALGFHFTLRCKSTTWQNQEQIKYNMTSRSRSKANRRSGGTTYLHLQSLRVTTRIYSNHTNGYETNVI